MTMSLQLGRIEQLCGSNGNELDVFGVQRIFGAGIQNDGLLVWAADTYEQWVAANQRPSIEDFKAAFPPGTDLYFLRRPAPAVAPVALPPLDGAPAAFEDRCRPTTAAIR